MASDEDEDDSSASSSDAISDFSKDFVEHNRKYAPPQVDQDALLQYMERQAREQLRESIASAISLKLRSEQLHSSVTS